MPFNLERDELVSYLNITLESFINCMLYENVVDAQTASNMRQYAASVEKEKSLPESIRDRIVALFSRDRKPSDKYRILISRVSPWYTQPGAMPVDAANASGDGEANSPADGDGNTARETPSERVSEMLTRRIFPNTGR